MPKPSEIFDTPEADSRVGGNEEQRQEFGLLFGASLSYDQQLLEAIWDWHLTTKDQEKEEAIKAEKNKTINRVLNIVSSKQNQFTSTYERGYQEAVKNILQSIRRLLPTEDNK